MIKARYIDEAGKSKMVTADEITPKENEKKYRGHLYCEYEDCPARMVYNEKQRGGFKRYFTTKQKDEHKKGCPNFINRSKRKGPTAVIGGKNTRVRNKHISDALREMHKDAKAIIKNKGKKLNRKKAQSSRNRNVSKLTDDNLRMNFLSTIGKASLTEGEVTTAGREPTIRRREIASVSFKDKNKTIGISGIADKAYLKNNKLYLELKSIYANKTERGVLYFGEAVQANVYNPITYFENMQLDINRIIKESEIIVNCIGECMVVEENNFMIQIYNMKDCWFEGLAWDGFIATLYKQIEM